MLQRGGWAYRNGIEGLQYAHEYGCLALPACRECRTAGSKRCTLEGFPL